MRGAAASVNLTIAASMATLVVVGGILAGPAILDCSKATTGLGACLRDRLDPTPPAPPVTEDGWIDVAANEYAPPASVPVELEAAPTALVVADLPAADPVPMQVAIVPPAELAIASPAPDAATTSVALIDPEGTLDARGGPELPPLDTSSAAPLAPAPDIAAPVEATSSEPAPVTLSAEALLSSEEPSSEAPPPEALSEDPALVVEFNPTYPNVIVLPTPLTGDNSSFRSLQLN